MALILCKETMIYNAGRRQVNQGGYRLGAIQAKRLKALNWGVRARIRHNDLFLFSRSNTDGASELPTCVP